MSVAVPQAIGTSPAIRPFMVPIPANDNRVGVPRPAANDNYVRVLKPPQPYGKRPVMLAYRPGISPALLVYNQLRARLEGWAAYEFSQLLRGISYMARPNVANSPGWHLAADCANGPGTFMGSFADPVYCGPLVAEPTPGGILEDPTSYNIKFYQFHPELGLGEWRFHELWSAVKWDGVTLYPPPAVVYDVAVMPLPTPWPWNAGWRAARHQVGWSYPLENRVPDPAPHVPDPRVPGVTVSFPPARPMPPGRGVKEVKINGLGRLAGLGWAAANIASELVDFIEALEKGLPNSLRAKPVWVPGGSEWNWTRSTSGKWHKEQGHYRAPTPQERASTIYDNWGSMDWSAALGAVATNEVQDRLFGKLGRYMATASNRSGRPIGYGAGPWDRPVQPRLSF